MKTLKIRFKYLTIYTVVGLPQSSLMFYKGECVREDSSSTEWITIEYYDVEWLR